MTLQENHGVDNVKHPNLVRLPSGRDPVHLYRTRPRGAAAARVPARFRRRVRDVRPAARHHDRLRVVLHQRRPHPPAQLGGCIILPCFSSPVWGRGDHYRAFCLYSDDEGETWQESRTKMDAPSRGAEEPAVIERRDGSLLAILRTTVGKLYRGWSTDAGENVERDRADRARLAGGRDLHEADAGRRPAADLERHAAV